MANAVGLNMKFTADTGGIKTGTKEVGKLLTSLGSSISKASGSLSELGASNAAAATAQQQLATDVAFLGSALRTGQVTAEQFKAEMDALSKAATDQAAAFSEGASLTAKYTSEEDKRAASVARLNDLLSQGAISQETYAKAVYDASGQAQAAKAAEAAAVKKAADEAAEAAAMVKAAEDAKQAVMKRGEAVIRANMTAEEKHAEQLEDLESLLRQGAIDTNQFQRAQDRLASQFNEVDKEGSQTNSMLKKMAGNLRLLTAIEIGRVLADAFRSVASAIGGMVSNITQSVGELTRLASVANTSVTQFQGLATAAATVGIEQDKFADILKDVGDRVGDFLQTGGGPMADFFENIAPKVGVTAEQFKNLSGPDALQLYVDSLEKAGLSQAEMTFYLEAMSSDLTALQPLLAQGGAGMDALAERAERLGIVLSEDQTSAIKEMNGALGLVYDTFEGIVGQVTANLAPVISAMAEDLLSFIEGYQGLGDGTGGTALADSITTALFDGAEYLAGIFDYFIGDINSWGESFSSALDVMASVFDIFTRAVAAAEAAFYFVRGVFNTFLAEASKWAASFVGLFSSAAGDFLKNFSQELGQRAQEDMKAAADAADRATREAEPIAAGTGMASEWVAEGRKRFENRGEPASGADQAAEDAKKAAEKEEAARKKAAEEALKAEEKRQKEILDVRNKYAEMSYDMEVERLDKLAANTTKALEVSDIRSGGISQVLALAIGREDPAVQEARKQVRKLDEIRNEIRNLGGTVEIVGAA